MANIRPAMKAAPSSFRSFEFATYNEAIAFASRSAMLNPSKPYKRVRAIGAPLWVVTVTNRAAMRSGPSFLPFLREPGLYWHGGPFLPGVATA